MDTLLLIGVVALTASVGGTFFIRVAGSVNPRIYRNKKVRVANRRCMLYICYAEAWIAAIMILMLLKQVVFAIMDMIFI